MKKIKTYIAFATVALGLSFSSCSENEETIDWNGIELKNTELKNVLQQKGFTFNEAGRLVQDDKVKSTTTLDLSNCNLSDISGLEVFPKLTDINLSDNKFTYSFDFSILPGSVTSVDLTGNEIYEYPGLVNIKTEENGDETVTVQRKLTKLLLPEAAKYNCVEIPTYFANSKETDMQMENAKRIPAAYTTLREVPDDNVRAILKELFPSMFKEDNIDISKRLVVASEKSKNISISPKKTVGSEAVEITSVEGFEYIAMNKGYEGAQISISASKSCLIPYLKLGSTFTAYITDNVSTPNLDISNAVNLCLIQITNDAELDKLDLSNCRLLGQRDYDLETSPFNNPSIIVLHHCDKLKTFTLPKEAKMVMMLQLVNLPLLEDIDLSGLNFIGSTILGRLPKSEIKYFDYTRWDGFGKAAFSITEEVFQQAGTKAFLEKYHSNLYYEYIDSELGLENFKWKDFYK